MLHIWLGSGVVERIIAVCGKFAMGSRGICENLPQTTVVPGNRSCFVNYIAPDVNSVG